MWRCFALEKLEGNLKQSGPLGAATAIFGVTHCDLLEIGGLVEDGLVQNLYGFGPEMRADEGVTPVV